MAIANVELDTSDTVIFSSSGDFMIATMIFCNTTDTTSADLTLYLVPDGSTVGSGTMIVNQLTIPETETVFFDTERLVLADGDSLVAVSSESNTITCTISTVAI
jgi:hypothetical protein